MVRMKHPYALMVKAFDRAKLDTSDVNGYVVKIPIARPTYGHVSHGMMNLKRGMKYPVDLM